MADQPGDIYGEQPQITKIGPADDAADTRLRVLYDTMPFDSDVEHRVIWEATEGDAFRNEVDRLLDGLQSEGLRRFWVRFLGDRMAQPRKPTTERGLAFKRAAYGRGLANLTMLWDGTAPRYAVNSPEFEAEREWQDVILNAGMPWDVPEHPIFGAFPPLGWPYQRPWRRTCRLTREQVVYYE